MNRYALTFTVRPGSATEVAEILAGYSSPPAGRSGPARPLLDRTTVFMAGLVVVRVVDFTCPPEQAIRHLVGQPQIRAVEERLRPHLTEDRDLSDDRSRRRFLATSVMRVVTRENGHGGGHLSRAAALYEALPGRGREVARILAAEGSPPGCGTTVFRRRDLVVHLLESPDPVMEVPLAGSPAPLVRLARPMMPVTDRVAGVRA